MKTLRGKVVVITGAGSGFGRSLALEVAARGGIPVLLDISQAGLDETARLVSNKGARSSSHLLDVRNAKRWTEVADAVVAEYGRVDVLINNAGVFSRTESFLETTEEHGRFIFDVNLWGVFHGTRTFVPLLARQPEAALMTVASSLAIIPSPMHSLYCASKAAIASFIEVVRQELSHTDILVTTVFPGPSKTNLGKNVQYDDKAKQAEDTKNFDKFALTPPEVVARRAIDGMLRGKEHVLTSTDGRLMAFFKRVSPSTGHSLMDKVYRKVGDPKLYARLQALGKS